MVGRRWAVTVFAGSVLAVASCAGDDGTLASTTSSVVPTSPTTAAPTGPTVVPPTAPTGPGSWLSGDARPSLAAGPVGQLSAAPIGDPQSTDGSTVVPFAIQNLTGAVVSGLGFAVAATDPTDGSTHQGRLLAMTPSRLAPGEWGLAAVRFLGVAQLPAGTSYTVSFPAADGLMSRAVDLEVGDLTNVDGRRGAHVTNTSTVALANPFTFAVFCFDGDRVVATDVQLAGSGPDGYTFAPGTATDVFFAAATCPSLLVGAVSFRA